MFKRKARLLFIDHQDSPRLALCQQLCAEIGDQWLEYQGCVLRPNPEQTANSQSELLQWADLFVTFCPETRAAITKPPQARFKDWFDLCDMDDEAAITTAVSDKLRCMVGGMRMLARLDEHPDDE